LYRNPYRNPYHSRCHSRTVKWIRFAMILPRIFDDCPREPFNIAKQHLLALRRLIPKPDAVERNSD
jgi:hypothetical protein